MATRRRKPPFYTGTTSTGGDVRRLRRVTSPSKRADAAAKGKRPRTRPKRRK